MTLDRWTNTATAGAVAPGGSPVAAQPSTATVTLTQSPLLTVAKVGTPAANADAVGDLINYTFTVTNTGNVTVHDVGVADVPTAPAGPSSPPECQSLSTPAGTCSGDTTTLAPGQSAKFTASYPVTQADLDHGSVADSATTSGLTPGDTPVIGRFASRQRGTDPVAGT